MNEGTAYTATWASVVVALSTWLPTIGLVVSIVASVLAAVASCYAIAYWRSHKKQ